MSCSKYPVIILFIVPSSLQLTQNDMGQQVTLHLWWTLWY